MIKLLAFALLLIGCASDNNFSIIRPGMNEKEVLSLVGKPKEKVQMPMSIVWWRYTDKEKHVVVMEEGKVTSVLSQGDKLKLMQKVDSVKAAH